MHKSRIVREKLMMKDANLSTLLIETALKKSEHSLHSLEDQDSNNNDDTPLLYESNRDSDMSDVIPRSSAEVSETDIRFTDAGDRLDSKSFVLDPSRSSKRIANDARELLNDDKSLINDVMKNSRCSDVLKPYRCSSSSVLFFKNNYHLLISYMQVDFVHYNICEHSSRIFHFLHLWVHFIWTNGTAFHSILC